MKIEIEQLKHNLAIAKWVGGWMWFVVCKLASKYDISDEEIQNCRNEYVKHFGEMSE